MIPVRCFTCGKIVGNKYRDYMELRKTLDGNDALNQLEIFRPCCRRMILAHADIYLFTIYNGR